VAGEPPQTKALLLGQTDAVNRLRLELPEATGLEPGCVVIEWDLGDVEQFLELARICHHHGCVALPVQNAPHARNIARAFLTPTGAAPGSW
jgi:hypothetical protein